MITCSNIKKQYDGLQVLKGVSLTIEKGELVCIVGPSGAGKSTLLHILGTLDTPDEGDLLLNGKKINGLNSNQLAEIRNKNLGFVFQFHHLLPEFTALENVCIPGFIARRNENEVKERARFLLDLMGLSNRLEHKPNELSGGEQQRVSVARALINNPEIILADEPTGNLDSNNSKELHQLFFDLKAKFNQTFVIVTHNEALAEMADRKLVMKDGLIVL
ncbi:MAG: ABC transporter ATP-binding protein [Bacteroidetes bacterium]|jgi:lipoprotein-releasing system ATP-binding protein|nr:ABC transporter ATP-binding protein [Bacteroidota bacterium]MBP7257103.1 ABC transporter ATP-binding protein [Chitinophagales bacterium]MBK7506269.1 ABC transporter ATP-binding protein [Bacteroidota bacterium]MBK7638709.1 ABC transporter ATP-binding protein [Bacteroidota bacterium]MBK8672235.1 ABC transporter ATP-binding protein [Bacteroidota bacterium]